MFINISIVLIHVLLDFPGKLPLTSFAGMEGKW